MVVLTNEDEVLAKVRHLLYLYERDKHNDEIYYRKANMKRLLKQAHERSQAAHEIADLIPFGGWNEANLDEAIAKLEKKVGLNNDTV